MQVALRKECIDIFDDISSDSSSDKSDENTIIVKCSSPLEEVKNNVIRRSENTNNLSKELALPIKKEDNSSLCFSKLKICNAFCSSKVQPVTMEAPYCLCIHTTACVTDVQIIEDHILNMNVVICCLIDNSIRVYSLISGVLLKSFIGATDLLNSTAVTPCIDYSSSMLSHSNSNNSIHSYSSKRSGGINVVPASQTTSPGMDIITTYIIAGSRNGVLYIWNYETTYLLHTIQAHNTPIYHLAVCIFQNQFHIVSCSDNAELYSWNIHTAKRLHTYIGPVSGSIYRVSALDPQLITKSNTNTSTRLNTMNNLLKDKPARRAQKSMYLFSGGSDKCVCVWNGNTGNCLRVLYGHEESITCLNAYYHSWSYIAVNTAAAGINKCPPPPNKETASPDNVSSGPCSVVGSAVVDSPGILIECLMNIITITGSQDGTIRVWDVHYGITLHVLVGHISPVINVSYILERYPVIISSSKDGVVQCWHLISGKRMKVYKYNENIIGMFLRKGLIPKHPLKILMTMWNNNACVLPIRELDVSEKSDHCLLS